MFTPGPSEVGGAARRSGLIARSLAGRGWEVFVIARAGTLRSFRRWREDSLTVVEIPGFGLGRLGAPLYYLLALPLGLWWGRTAEVLLAVQLSSPSMVAALVSKILGRPYLAFATSSGRVSEIKDVSESAFARIRTGLLARASWLVAQTPEAAQELSALTGTRDVTVLPNPVVLGDVPALTGHPAVMFAGRFSAEKDLLNLLRGWHHVVARVPGARLTLVGEGGSYRSVEAEIRRLVGESSVLGSSVRLTGWVEETSALYANHDVFVLPSVSEGMSNALLEACARGRVVVASDISANRYVLGADYPLLFRPGSVPDMVDRLVRGLTDSASRATAAARVQERIVSFSIDAVLDELEGLIRDASNSPRH